MTKSHTHKRYQIGYNKPVEGAVGDSPQEFRLVAETDNPSGAIAEIDNLRKDSGDAWGRKAFILDTKHNALATIVTGPGDLPTRLITYVGGKNADAETVIGSDGKSYPLDDPNIPG